MRPSLLLAGALLCAPLGAQTTRHVPAQYATIQAAVQAAVDGDTVLVAPGVYSETLIHFSGKKIALVSSGGPAVTTIDAHFANRAIWFDGGEDASTRLEGFTIERGQAPFGGGTAGDGGGAILMLNASPWIRNCVFRNCRADAGTDGGGGQAGHRGGHGGALYLVSSSPRIERCRFESNVAGRGGQGGAGATGAIGTLFSPDGKTGGTGGAGGHGGFGGAIYMEGTSAPAIVSSAFVGNASGQGGAGGTGGRGGQGLLDALFGWLGDGGRGGRGGAAGRGGDGAALYATSTCTPTVVGCTLVEGHLGFPGAGGSGGPGGIGGANGPVGANGSAAGTGTGGAIHDAGGADTALASSIVWSNDVPALVQVAASFCTVQGGASGPGNLAQDPLLAADLSLFPGSPCIDAGDRTQLPAWSALDLLGRPRAFEHPLVSDTGFGGTPMMDIGAAEVAQGWVLDAGCGTNAAGSLVVTAGLPAPGVTVSLALDNPFGTQLPGSIPYLLVAAYPDPSPCGTLLPGHGMELGAPAALLVDLVTLPPLALGGAPWQGPGQPTVFDLAFPPSSSELVGLTLHLQGVLFDFASQRWTLTQGVDLLVGP